jgi:hypothetical protein
VDRGGVCAAVSLCGCTYYQTPPGTHVTAPASVDRSWAAAVGAAVLTQADGSVRVEFTARGDTRNDPGLLGRVSDAYDRRMGR